MYKHTRGILHKPNSSYMDGLQIDTDTYNTHKLSIDYGRDVVENIKGSTVRSKCLEAAPASGTSSQACTGIVLSELTHENGQRI